MLGSALTLTMFGSVPHWANFFSVPYYVVVWSAFGVVQACGWPNEVSIMANWFPRTNRGFIMGLWAACQPVGNILGALVISMILPMGYEYTFVFNSLLIALGAVALWVCVDSRPPTVEAQSPASIDRIGRHASEAELRRSMSNRPVSMCEALMLPSVLPYCLCNACLKFVNYAFFFWLPFYLTNAYHWSESEANRLAVWYDLGGIVGSVAGGYVSDRIGHRAPVLMAMLSTSLPMLFLYSGLGDSRALHILMMTLLGVTISGPYNLIVGTIAVDLGSQPALAGNEAAMSTVTGLIDGVGSGGSAVGQLFIPLIQNAIGWHWVFYLFIVMNFLSALCLLKRFLHDCSVMWRTRLVRGNAADQEHEPLLSF